MIIEDYLEKYGDDGIGGINFVGAISSVGTDEAIEPSDDGGSFLELIAGFESADIRDSVDTLESFIDRLTHGELTAKDSRFMLGFNVIVPPHVREALHSRAVTHDDELKSIERQVLITHGKEDRITPQETAHEHSEIIDTAEVSLYPDTGHAPFWEAPDRFNRELREFAADL